MQHYKLLDTVFYDMVDFYKTDNPTKWPDSLFIRKLQWIIGSTSKWLYRNPDA
jgi:hypothetical protein